MGDADLYVKIELLNKTKAQHYSYDWTLPSEANFTYESRTKLNTEMINIPKKELVKHCNFKEGEKGKYVRADPNLECLIVFGLVPYNPSSSANQSATSEPTKQTDIADTEILYNFAVYQSVLQLQPFTPSYGQAIQNQYTYFLYKVDCDTCNLMISVSTQV